MNLYSTFLKFFFAHSPIRFHDCSLGSTPISPSTSLKYLEYSQSPPSTKLRNSSIPCLKNPQWIKTSCVDAFSKYLINKHHPKIGSGLKFLIKNKRIKNTIFYIPRKSPGYDLIFFLGLIKLNKVEISRVLEKRIIKNLKL